MMLYTKVQEDCSGATALVAVPVYKHSLGDDCPMFLFAFDLLGEVKVNFVGIKNDDGYAVRCGARHVAAAKALYMHAVVNRLSPRFLDVNRAMYRTVQS